MKLLRAPRTYVIAAVLLSALVGTARYGLWSWFEVRTWFSEETMTQLGLALDDAPDGRPRAQCSGLAVLVLDDHPVARLVAAALAADLAAQLGADVPVHDTATAAFAPGDAARPDVLALVDLVHIDVEDWLVYQRCQVRLNVAVGRPPRAANDLRTVERLDGHVLDLEAPFYLEYSVDGHWEVIGLAAEGEHFSESAESIATGLGKLVEAVDWDLEARGGDPGALAGAAPPRDLPPFVPAGAQQRIYDIVRANGSREVLLQVTTEHDWVAELEGAEATALGLGWQRLSRTPMPDGRPRACVLARVGERCELTLAYMQGTLRAAGEQRQVLTFLHRCTLP